jgi:hypothetical protein
MRDIDVVRLVAADALEAAIFDDAQDFLLNREAAAISSRNRVPPSAISKTRGGGAEHP